MRKIFQIFKEQPIHLLLLPLYFIVHKTFQYSGLLDKSEIVTGFVILCIAITACFFIFLPLFKVTLKSAVFSTVISFWFLFFGDIKQSFTSITLLDKIAHYKILIPMSFLSIGIFFYILRKKNKPILLNYFLNILLLIYFFVDCIALFRIQSKSGRLTVGGGQLLSLIPANNNNYTPNIYYIIADGYPSGSFQKEVLGIDIAGLDSSLTKKGFYIARNSKSNYSNTAFSMASIFGLDYLKGVDTSHQIAAYQYNKCMKMVATSPFLKFIRMSGYEINNLSIFDLETRSAFKKDQFLSATTSDIIFYSTFYHCIKRDLFWQLIPGYLAKAKKERMKNMRQVLLPFKTYNQGVTDSLLMTLNRSGKQQPFFLYLHLKMPHFPYFFDSTGKEMPDDSVFTEPIIRNTPKFKGYIHYTNQYLEKIVNAINKKSNGKDIIIIQSDHGTDDFGEFKKSDAFRNFSAFYFPGKDYRSLNDSMSNVNTFRVILNKYFSQKLEMLPTKTYYLK